MSDRIPIIHHVLHTITVGDVVVKMLLLTAGRNYREAVRFEDRRGAVGMFLSEEDDLANIEAAARQAREWLRNGRDPAAISAIVAAQPYR